MRAGDQLDGVETRPVHRLRDRQHHARGHVLRPQALVAVTDRRIDEFDTVGSHLSKPRNLLTTKIPARLRRNQKENATFTTKVTKSTKLRSLKISRVRNLRDLRGEIVFLIQELRKDASENLRRPRQFSRIVVQSSQSSENL